MENILKLVLLFISTVFATIFFGCILGAIVMLLWNWIMPVIFGLPEITFLQGWGLCILTSFLFKTNVSVKNEK